MCRFLIHVRTLAPFLVWAETPEAALILAGDWLGLAPGFFVDAIVTHYPEHP